MPKSGRRYITSSKPALWGGGSSEVASTIAPPVKYRAEENTYTEVGGKKLYKRGGTLATVVVKKRFTPEIKIVNLSENIWREGL